MAKKTSQYKPKNPNDPKNPFANDEFFDVPSRDVEVVTKRAKPSKERSQFDLKANESNQTLELETLKSRVSSILRKNTANSNMVIDENNPASLEFLDKEERKFGEFVMPDPDSVNNLKAMRTTEYKLEYNKKHQEEVRLKIRGLQDVIRTKLEQDDIDTIVQAFQHNVIKVGKTEVILKAAKYGFEIYYNNADERWWIVTLQFEEPFNPVKLNYITYWVGNSFIGYGHKTLAKCLEKTREMLTKGRTGSISWRDFVNKFDVKANRIYSSDVPMTLNFTQYKKFVTWFKQNKIWIMVKKEGMKDSEDLMLEIRDKRKKGEKINPLAGVQAKLLEPPRKPNFITAYPVANPGYDGDDYTDPKNKLYQIGFTFYE